MASVERQNRLLAAEDWKKIYQSFTNAEFRSYDFDSLRRTMVTYLRENYPEDFNDYIESSEYLALIDLISFLGQNLAFRFDLNARDNFLELAERRESILRLARLVSYNPKRNQCANGLLKISSITTTENVIDSNGRNLSGQTIVWNDPANSNWLEQFIRVINSGLPTTAQFGTPNDSAVISGISTEQYRFSSSNTEVPVYSFSKNIDGRNMLFEVVSSSFADSNKIYEEPPLPGNRLAFLYRNDGGGPASSNTGFFLHFRQGSLQESTFSINRPSTNETLDLDASNINNSDVWLYSLDSIGIENDLWTKVESVEGNNVIYNSTDKNIRKIFSVLTRTGDRIKLIFADGTFGDLPQGNFKAYYRVSNGQTYSINPNDIKNVSIEVPYISKSGNAETLTIVLSLKYTVSNASQTESNESIKNNAPATYYTQGRMITGEDYSVLPLGVNQEIIKVKSVNRTSSGISRYFDLRDASGKYSSTNLFGTDGILYRENITNIFTFGFASRTEIEGVINNQVASLLRSRNIKDFYLSEFPYINLEISELGFFQITSATNLTTGYIGDLDGGAPKRLGDFTSSNLRFALPDSVIKVVPPAGKVFSKTGRLIDSSLADKTTKDYIWTKIINVVGDGRGNDGVLNNGSGPVTLNDVVPFGSIITTLIPKFTTVLEDAVKEKMIDLIFANKNFGLRYDITEAAWRIVSEANLDRNSDFSLGKTGDISNQQIDASWLILFETNGESYTVTNRGLRYIFESEQEIRFYFDSSDKVYDSKTGKVITDKIRILDINTEPDSLNPIGRFLDWEIVEEYKGNDGYVDSRKISISFSDSDADGVPDDPDLFDQIVAPEVNSTNKYIFQERRVGIDNVVDYFYLDNFNDMILVFDTDDAAISAGLSNLQLVYIVRDNLVKTYYTTGTLIPTQNYRAFQGRSSIKFQYTHAADSSVRLDPSTLNIIDVYLLTKTYDTNYRRWLRGEINNQPLPPSSDALYTDFGQSLDSIKSISDEVIYHPVKYKNLFGSTADRSLQAVFKIVKNSFLTVSDNDIKTNFLTYLNEFFASENWDLGDTFYFGELSTYILSKMSPDIVNIIIVPRQENLSFGSLFEIKANPDEIFVSSATINDIEIITEITASQLRASGSISSTATQSNNRILSS